MVELFSYSFINNVVIKYPERTKKILLPRLAYAPATAEW
jgi:hypothetical protein